MGTGYQLSKVSSYANLFILLCAVVLLYVTGSYRHISTSLLSVLPESRGKEIIRKFEGLHGTKTLLLAVKGFDDTALEKITRIELALKETDFVKPKEMGRNGLLESHRNRYRLYVDGIDAEKLDRVDVSGALSKLYERMTQSFFPITVDRYDPLGIYLKESSFPVKLHNGHAIIKGYGYLSYFDIDSRNLEEHTELYHQIQKILSMYSPDELMLFSPIFYYVENAAAIKADANRIVLIAALLLALLYLYMLRNIRLLFHAMTTLAASAAFAVLAVTSLYSEVSIFVIVFGVSISTVSIDYLFHHYFHGYYERKRAFNREVFYGFLTTAGAFAILSFSGFSLIGEISLFSLVSLTFSYLLFAFLYPEIGFKHTGTVSLALPRAKKQISSRGLLLFSLCVIILSPLWLRLDSDIKNLDYQNRALQNKESFFKTHLPQGEMVNILIEADSVDQLICYARETKSAAGFSHIPLSELVDSDTFKKRNKLAAKLKKLKKEISDRAAVLGFRKGYFDDAYQVDLRQPHYTMEDLEKYDMPVLSLSGKMITYATVDKKSLPLLETLPYIKLLSIKTLFEKSMQQNVDRLIMLGIFAIFFIIVMLLAVTKKGVLRALTYLVFPLAVIVIYGILVPLNILHIFMIFIVLSISIDYAIYTTKGVDADTRQSIAFSLMSTFAGFGVLVFSRINALFSIGIVATLGISALLFLLIFLKGDRDVSDTA